MRVLVALCAFVAIAHAAPLHGVVIDRDTREPIEGAIVMGEHATASTGADGAFDIALGDESELVVTAPGYGLRSIKIGRASVIELAPASGAEQIEITGKAPDPPRPQKYELTAEDIRIIPGTGNDILRAAQTLPGVARLPYSFGGLVLRGSSPRDNAVYLDGIEVPLAFHFGGLTSFYPSGMLTDLTVENGGFDAAYGRAEGGIVRLTTREPRRDRWRTGGSVGLLDSSVFAEGPLKDGAILMGVRRSYFDAVAIAFAPSDVPLPSYLDAQVRMSFGDPTRGGRITPLIFVALDHVSATSDGKNGHEDTSTITGVFLRAGAPYLRQFGPLALRVVPWIGLDSLSFSSITNGVAETFERPKYPLGTRAELVRDYAWGELRGGLDYEGGYLSHTQEGLGQPGDVLQQENGDTSLWWSDLALWSDVRFSLADDRMSIKPGVRAEHYGLSSELVVDPRIAVRERLTDTLVLRQTIGRFHQPPTPGDVDPNGGNPSLQSSYYDQLAVGVAGEWPGLSASLTGYAGFGANLGIRTEVNTQDFQNLGGLGPTFELLLEKQLGLAFHRRNEGRATNVGIELLIKRQTERWFWMIAYTLSRAQRTDPYTIGTVLAANGIGGVFDPWRPFELDQTHNLNLVASRALGKWRLGARVQIVSGTPYTPYGLDLQQPLDSANLPWFFQLDVRADRRWPQCWGDVALYIDIQNATNRSNVEAREQTMDFNVHPDGYNDLHGLPIAPFIGVEFVPK